MNKRFRFGEPGAIEIIVNTLRQGGVAILPTDTIYGFSTALSSEPGIRRIAAGQVRVIGQRLGARAAT